MHRILECWKLNIRELNGFTLNRRHRVRAGSLHWRACASYKSYEQNWNSNKYRMHTQRSFNWRTRTINWREFRNVRAEIIDNKQRCAIQPLERATQCFCVRNNNAITQYMRSHTTDHLMRICNWIKCHDIMDFIHSSSARLEVIVRPSGFEAVCSLVAASIGWENIHSNRILCIEDRWEGERKNKWRLPMIEMSKIWFLKIVFCLVSEY